MARGLRRLQDMVLGYRMHPPPGRLLATSLATQRGLQNACKVQICCYRTPRRLRRTHFHGRVPGIGILRHPPPVMVY
jgi:hypothetical protein